MTPLPAFLLIPDPDEVMPITDPKRGDYYPIDCSREGCWRRTLNADGSGLCWEHRKPTRWSQRAWVVRHRRLCLSCGQPVSPSAARCRPCAARERMRRRRGDA